MGITFAYLNYLEDASPITASSEENTFPAENVINPFRSLAWRTQAGEITSQYIDFDLGYQIENPNTFIIVNEQRGIQLSESATITLKACNDGNWSSAPVSVSIDWHEKIIMKFSSTGWGNYRFWRVALSDANATENYLEIGNIFLGRSFTPSSTDLNVGWGFTVIDDSLSQASDGNEIWFDQRTQRDRYNLELNLLTKADRDSLEELYDYTGQHRPFYIVLDPDEIITTEAEELTIYCRLTSQLRFINVFKGFYNSNIEVQEVV